MHDIKKIEKWLKKKSFSIVFENCASDCIDFKNETIFINSLRSNDSKVAGLLHECGHLVLRSSLSFNEAFPTINKVKRKKSLRCYIETLADEIFAWQMGEMLIKELNLNIKIEKYRRLRDVDVKTYAVI